eukprot:1047219-Pelagomonas_calceolata.AAC.1
MQLAVWWRSRWYCRLQFSPPFNDCSPVLCACSFQRSACSAAQQGNVAKLQKILNKNPEAVHSDGAQAFLKLISVHQDFWALGSRNYALIPTKRSSRVRCSSWKDSCKLADSAQE